MNYFDKLPVITYNNMLCRNLLARAKLSDDIRTRKEVFYPYSMDSEDYLDTIANDYYDDPGFAWLIALTNGYIDPYFDVPLSEVDFFNFIVKKYGSYAKAARRIQFYRNNWIDDTTKLEVTQYNNLTPRFKKYYEPILDVNLNVSSYKRKKDDTIINTNRIQVYSLTNITGIFEVGEEVQVDGTNYAFVTSFANSTLSVQHVNGVLSGSIQGKNSGAVATINSVISSVNTIVADDPTYWVPVTCLEYEQEINEMKKHIRLLDPRFSKQAENDLRRVMNSR